MPLTTQKERVELIVNSLVSEFARAVVEGKSMESAIAILEMNTSDFEPRFKQVAIERLQTSLAGKNVFGQVWTAFQFISVYKDINQQLVQLMEWAGKLLNDRIDSATDEELQTYAQNPVGFADAISSVTQELFLEKGL